MKENLQELETVGDNSNLPHAVKENHCKATKMLRSREAARLCCACFCHYNSQCVSSLSSCFMLVVVVVVAEVVIVVVMK